jgi:oxygen-independent coproporphyrinogen-3 oxidase
LRILNDFYKDESITSIYFGGGTPSLLPPSFVAEILNLIDDACDVEKEAEITLEVNPLTINLRDAKRFKAAGINRLSIGVQSIIDADLKMLGRIHGAYEAKNCVLEMSEVFNNISIDLIYNRPGQRLEAWIDELHEALLLPIQHVSLYELIVEDGTAMKRMIESGELPRPSEGSEFIETTWMIAENCHFHRYEVSNFSKPGFVGRHNLSYWKYEDYYGIGPGAHSRIKLNGRKVAIEQAKDIGDWISFASNDEPFELIELTESEEFDERLIMGLRAEIGIDIDIVKIDRNKMQFLLKNSYIMLRDSRMSLTNDGLLKLNLIVEYLSGKRDENIIKQ